MQLIAIPELTMSIDEIDDEIQKKAERKIELHKELLQLDAEIMTLAALICAKAIKELGV